MRAELRALKRPAVPAALAVTVVGSGAMFTVFTYIAPILHDATHVSPAFVTGMLVLYGVCPTVGDWLGGRYADRALDRTLIVVLAALTALLLLFAITMHWPMPAAVSIFAWGVATFALVPPLQMRVMATASDAPNLASSINIGAFNLGNALGAGSEAADRRGSRLSGRRDRRRAARGRRPGPDPRWAPEAGARSRTRRGSGLTGRARQCRATRQAARVAAETALNVRFRSQAETALAVSGLLKR